MTARHELANGSVQCPAGWASSAPDMVAMPEQTLSLMLPGACAQAKSPQPNLVVRFRAGEQTPAEDALREIVTALAGVLPRMCSQEVEEFHFEDGAEGRAQIIEFQLHNATIQQCHVIRPGADGLVHFCATSLQNQTSKLEGLRSVARSYRPTAAASAA